MNLIKIYINNLTKEESDRFLKNNDIFLSNDELEYLYNKVRNNYEDIIKEDKNILEDIENNIDKDNYNKLYILFKEYKKKYL